MSKYNKKHAFNLDFDIGDYVMVMDCSEVYPRYIDWVKKNCPQYLDEYIWGMFANNGTCGEVICMAKHSEIETYLNPLIGVLVGKTQFFVIDAKGLIKFPS